MGRLWDWLVHCVFFYLFYSFGGNKDSSDPWKSNCPARDLFETGDHPQRSRLSASGRSNKHHEPTVLDVQTYILGRCEYRASPTIYVGFH
jgi:hypothetical protein